MRLDNSLNQQKRASTARGLFLGVLMCLFAFPILAQKVVVLTNADMGKVVTGTHHYSEADQTFKLSLKHRLLGVGPMQVSLMKTTQFEKGPFDLIGALPQNLGPDQTLDIEFSINYSKGVQTENTISLLVLPLGETDVKTKGIALNLKLTADPKLMFWNERAKQYTKSLPAYQFIGPDERLVELTWNGSGNGVCVYAIEDDGRASFSLVPNASGASAVTSGTSLSLSKGGNSYYVKYIGSASKTKPDVARMTFSEPGGQTLVLDLMGTYQGGTSLFAMAKDMLSKGNLKGGYQPAVVEGGGKENIKNGGNSDPKNAYTGLEKLPSLNNGGPILENSGNPNNANGNNGSNGNAININGGNGSKDGQALAINSRPSPRPTSINLNVDNGEALTSEQAIDRLTSYFLRHKDENLLKLDQAKFELIDGIYEARIPVSIDSVFEDPNFHITPIWVSVKTPDDSVALPMSNVVFLSDSLLLRVKMSSEAEKLMAREDSFQVYAGFMPEYMAGNTPNYLVDQTQVFRGQSYAKMYSNSRWLTILLIALGVFFFLFFLVGYLIARQPITTFRYLREARYQRERHKANSDRQRVDVETVHIDLARHDIDLIQLAFIERDEDLDGSGGLSSEKVRSILSTVPTPLHGGLKRMFVWLYAPFGRKREPRFKSVYYSLRIEMVKGGIPNNLRLKDETGMILLGTTLTGNVLATDHQDFKFNKRPFSYSVYVDPAEFLDYTGAMRSVSIPFRVIEEPFEGYVMTREFNLNLEIAQRY